MLDWEEDIMKEYINPTFELQPLSDADVIATSGDPEKIGDAEYTFGVSDLWWLRGR